MRAWPRGAKTGGEKMAFVIGISHVEVVRASLETSDALAQALMRAALTGQAAAISALVDKGADVNAKDQSGRTALMEAAFGGHVETVQALIERGADVNAKDHSGWTALMEAASKGHTRMVRVLLDAGADAKVKHKKGWTALKAAAKGHVEIIKLLKRAEAAT
jgi:ankyrin repeat protein